MEADLSIVTLVMNASLLVQGVMLLLLLLSIASWVVIFRKSMQLKAARREADAFENQFWSGVDMVSLYEQVKSNNQNRDLSLASVFENGFREFVRLRKQSEGDSHATLEGAYRAMNVSSNRVQDQLELTLPFLATVGSTSPYIGLFGTVWGIMNSFRALGGSNQATLAMVAPGIAEALIATAMGLFAAIPAVIAYNRYRVEVERLAQRNDNFIDEFISILQRQGGRPPSKSVAEQDVA